MQAPSSNLFQVKPTTTSPSAPLPPSQASDLLLQVFAAAVVSWGDHATPLLLGVRPQWLPRLPGLRHTLYGEGRLAEGVLPVCLQALPHSLKQLLDREPWSGQAQKVSRRAALTLPISQTLFVSHFSRKQM